MQVVDRNGGLHMDALTLVLVSVCFVIGYYFISYIYTKKDKNNNKESYYNEQSASSSNEQENFKKEDEASKNRDNTQNVNGEFNKDKCVNLEIYYADLLELAHDLSPSNIKHQYRKQLSLYHPDKVSHLGREFQDIAEKKTEEIIKAYNFFREKYSFR